MPVNPTQSPINRLMVANRGEIARRIMRSCRDLGIETVAVYSDPDANAAFVTEADYSVALGGSTPAESYLRVDALIEAAKATGADAVHPGYGFLAENADFARAVQAAGLVFVGPTPEVITVMDSKLEAKARMVAAGVPVLPSAQLTGLSDDAAILEADKVGYPILIKSSAGGGGRGMRIVLDSSDLVEAVTAAGREAESAFGDGTVYAERYVSPSRHVEVQIFGDSHGNVVHLHERECSIQRRYQKIIEEAPSPSLDDSTRERLHDAAVRAGAAIGYTNAGTVEFLLAPPGADGTSEFFFLEVNTRLQVEHPVTEAVLGLDLVEMQLHVAEGGELMDQASIGMPQGHAIEARLYAEDPRQDYLPSTGTVTTFSVPEEVRTDSSLWNTAQVTSSTPATPAARSTGTSAGAVSQFYDPMVAKVIAHGSNRRVAAGRLAGALRRSVIDGITTNRDLLVRTLRHPEFLEGRGDSDFLVRNDPAVLGRPLVEGPEALATAAAAALALQADNRSHDRHTASVNTGFRNVATQPQTVELTVASSEDQVLPVSYLFRGGRLVSLSVGDHEFMGPVLHNASRDRVDLTLDGVRQSFHVRLEGPAVSVSSAQGSIVFDVTPRFTEPGEKVVAGSTVATMPGTVVSVAVEVGKSVGVGEVLLVMEAMKMELAVKATTEGVVTEVSVAAGDAVEAGAVLAVVSPVGEAEPAGD